MLVIKILKGCDNYRKKHMISKTAKRWYLLVQTVNISPVPGCISVLVRFL